MNTKEQEWIPCSVRLPEDGYPVETKIDDGRGCRNEAVLKRRGSIWFLKDGSMYVYYKPTHWRPK